MSPLKLFFTNWSLERRPYREQDAAGYLLQYAAASCAVTDLYIQDLTCGSLPSVLPFFYPSFPPVVSVNTWYRLAIGLGLSRVEEFRLSLVSGSICHNLSYPRGLCIVPLGAKMGFLCLSPKTWWDWSIPEKEVCEMEASQQLLRSV